MKQLRYQRWRQTALGNGLLALLAVSSSSLSIHSVCNGQSQNLSIFRRAEKSSRPLKAVGIDLIFNIALKREKSNPVPHFLHPSSLSTTHFCSFWSVSSQSHKGTSSQSDVDVQSGLHFQSLRKAYAPKSSLVLTHAFALGRINRTHQLKSRCGRVKWKAKTGESASALLSEQHLLSVPTAAHEGVYQQRTKCLTERSYVRVKIKWNSLLLSAEEFH